MIPPEKIDGMYQHSRCVGFYHNLEKAQICVLNGGRGMCESYYDYAIIEEKNEGYMSGPYLTKEYWYKWNEKKGNYFPCKKPKRFKSVVCFGIG